ncbi:MAG: hypothetical protein C3F11_03610 [Methylocystaceae bacterium]|nr:MAG: hypothetical protein C3F11_03610 [Methylocystaceae bacterium]
MTTFGLGFPRTARSSTASGIVAFLLLQTLFFVLSANGWVDFGDVSETRSVVSAAEMCRSQAGDDHSPAQPSGRHHCALCVVGCDDEAAKAVALFSSVLLVLAPRSDAASGWPLCAITTSRPARQASCSSRAPPSIS